MSSQAQAVVQAQQKTAVTSSNKGNIVQRAATVPEITSIHGGILQRCSGGVECEECRQKRLEREGTLQRAAVNKNGSGVPPIVHEVLGSSGQALDTATRGFMEPRFGYDFSGVRVHTGNRAAESARAVNAVAYTVGRDVVFGEGKYAPETSEGKRLMAHELTHVVQQDGRTSTIQTQLRIGSIDDAAEKEADYLAGRILNMVPASTKQSAQVSTSQAPVLRRTPDAPRDFSTPQRIGENEARAATLPRQTRGQDQVQIHVIRSFLPCPCHKVSDPRSGIFYNPDLSTLAIAYRYCRGGTTLDVYGQLQSNALAFLQGQTPPQGTGIIGIDINVVGRNVGGRVVLEAVGTNQESEGVGGRAQVVFQGGRWRVFVTSDFLHRLRPTGTQSENQLDLRLGGQLGTVTAQVDVTNILSSQVRARGTVCIPLGGVNLCPFIEGGERRGVTGGVNINIPLGGPTVRQERCFQCLCPPPVRKYECMEDVLPREEEVKTQVPVEREHEYRYYFELDRTDEGRELHAQSAANLSELTSQVRGGARIISITGYASPETSESHNQDLSRRRAMRLRDVVRKRVGRGLQLPEPFGGGELLGRRPEPTPSSRLGDAVSRGFGGLSAEDISIFLHGEEIPNRELANQFISLFNNLTEPADRLALFGLTRDNPIAQLVLNAIDQFVQSRGRGYRPWERVFQALRVGVVRMSRTEMITETETVRHPGSLQPLSDDAQCQQYARQAEATGKFGPIDPSALVPTRESTGHNLDCEDEPGRDELHRGCTYEIPSNLRQRATPPAIAPRELR
ncbi:MAG: hypothetical protein NVSMB27_00210 [Ktedonobacteraceae bacterium]